ncbi:hypothetical protein BDR05DRAFT_948085 [Suillus weaverae]|nr:hypothetical protein BDR05DRAFT_948085 [Suillus weaverae]
MSLRRSTGAFGRALSCQRVLLSSCIFMIQRQLHLVSSQDGIIQNPACLQDSPTHYYAVPIPAEKLKEEQKGDLTVDEIKALTIVKSKRKLMIQTWYRSQTNAAHLARSGRLKGALGLSKTLSGGDEGEADAAIKAEGISTRGKKLARRKDLTRAKYATEDDDIRAEVQEKHQEALASWKEKWEMARAGFVQEVEQEDKIKALNELGAHLDHIFCHLSHKTGSYHLRETDIGSEFSAQYTGFGEVQTAYTDFVKLALAHDDNMQALADAGDADEIVNNNSDGEPNESNELFGLGSQADEEKAEEGRITDNTVTGMELNGLYEFDLMDDYMSAVDSSMGAGTITGIATVPNNNVTPLDFDQLDFSSLDMADVDTFFNSLPCDPFTASGPSTLEDLNFGFMHNFSRSPDFSYSLPPFPAEPTLPAFAGNTSMHSTTPPPHSDYQLPTTPSSSSGINVIDSNTCHEPLMNLPVGRQEDSTDPLSLTPSSASSINMLDSNLNTCHKPLTTLRVGLQDNPGGARVHPPVSASKENNKRKATHGHSQQETETRLTSLFVFNYLSTAAYIEIQTQVLISRIYYRD